MPRGQSYSINPDPSAIPQMVTLGRRRTIDGGYEQSGPLPTPDDYVMSLPDYGRQDTQMDPYSQGVRRTRDYIGSNYAKPYVGEFAAGAVTDDVLGDLLRGTPQPKGQSGMRTAGNVAQVAAMVPEGIWSGAKSAVTGAVRAAEPAIARLLGREAAPVAEEMGRFGRSPQMLSIANDAGRSPIGTSTQNRADKVIAAVELRNMGLPESEIQRVMANAGEGTVQDIHNIRNMGPTDEMDLLTRLHARGQGIPGGSVARPPAPPPAPARAPAIITPSRTLSRTRTGERVSPAGLILPQEPFKPTSNRILSINPAAWENPDRTPTIEELIGHSFTTEDVPSNVHGINEKIILRDKTGKGYMYKGGGGNSSSATLFDRIGESGQGLGRLGSIREEAGSRLANLINMKTPTAVEVAEGGTVQPFIHGGPSNISAMKWDERYRGAVPPMTQNRADFAKGMLEEQVIDTLGQTSDRHGGQFMFDPQTGQMWGADKGYNDLLDYKGTPRSGMGSPGYYIPDRTNVAEYYDTYGKFNRGGEWNKHLDPEVYRSTIARMKGIPESSYRSALSPLKRSMGSYSDLTNADFDTLMRNFMGEIDTLGPRFEQYYNFHKP